MIVQINWQFSDHVDTSQFHNIQTSFASAFQHEIQAFFEFAFQHNIQAFFVQAEKNAQTKIVKFGKFLTKNAKMKKKRVRF